ncbi:putative membrane protein YfcA [Arthrobacter pascens]|uniref:sulfite exporter TauE/SafE family protein n=1 Tax=Arthrobacter pascens TaxID=1677 RepID=UPI00285489EC|nr:sulfite exporter TauE/SafE family protein [Arthrobacter pascens]MDR6558295.1 putative membrane protein YfcA [Arthrobacter pascens]
MTAFEAVALILAGMAAGTLNTVVGSGSLITFPVLLAMGYPPVLANVTNNVGVLPGSLSGAWAYREHLHGQGKLLALLITCAGAGGVLGAVLLLNLPASVFDAVVPALILFACLLVVLGPLMKNRLAGRRGPTGASGDRLATIGPGAFMTAVYGGYFGAGQGIILLSLLSVGMSGTLHRSNAFKNVLGASANIFAAIVFLSATHIAWAAAGFIAVGAVIGGQIGGRLGKRLPPSAYRLIIVAVGITAITYFYIK